MAITLFHFPSHTLQQTQKCLGSPPAELISLSTALLLRKKINNHVFKVMWPTVKFVPLPFLKNVCHRKASARLTANSENNYLDTTILACENEMDKKDWVLMHT